MEYGDEFHDSIRKVASSVARDWVGMTTPEELEQDLWVEVLSRPIKSLEEFDQVSLTKILFTRAKRILAAQRLDFEVFSGQFHYSVTEIRGLLREGFLTEQLAFFSAELADLRIGLDHLEVTKKQYADAIWKNYAWGEPVEKSQLSRALTSLTEAANKSYRERCEARPDGPGSRKVMPTTKAIAMTE